MTYTVQAGDTAFSISARFGFSVQALEAANPGVNFDDLQIGQQLNTPGGQQGGSGQTYTVQSGDTLFSIGQKFGVSVQDLEAANPGLNVNDMQIGQVINI